MAIRSDSYSSAAEVVAVTRHLLDGEATFNTITKPTLTEVEKFIDRSSGVLNLALWQHGFNPANITANSTAKLAMDDWVTARAAEWVELTQRGAGWSDQENTRIGFMGSLSGQAMTYVAGLVKGFKNQGITVTDSAGQGLRFTGQTLQEDRADPDDTSLEQPKFKRNQWDNP